MEFEWDPAKNAECIARRGIDFADAARIFERWVFERIDRRKTYGEVRVVAIGLVESDTLTLVYTDRIDLESGTKKRRIVASWRSSRRERKAYQQATASR